MSNTVDSTFFNNNNNLWLRVKLYHYDLMNYKSCSESVERLECEPMALYFMTNAYFSEEERELLLNFPSNKNVLLKDSLESMISNKIGSDTNEICSSHDLAPIIAKTFKLRKNYYKEKVFKEFLKNYQKNNNTIQQQNGHDIHYLSKKNAHPRDLHISFEEGPHIYTVCGERGTYTSVTTWNHSHFAHFDANSVIDKLLSSKKMNDPSYKYYNKTREQILKEWDDNRDKAASAGTKMHYDIECYFNGLDVKNESTEFQYFKRFVTDFPDLKPYRTEWMVYYEELKLSGSIDMVFENPDGTLQIYDWKRCQEIKHEDEFSNKRAITPCISHLPDTNFWHYALQLNMYKTILEHKYGKIVTDLYLVCIHPDNTYKNYQRIKVPFLEEEMKALVELRLCQVSNVTKK